MIKTMSVTDSETLKHQFQLIQEQQQKKLLARKQKKGSAKEITPGSTQDCWGLEEDLDLKLDTKILDDEKLQMNSELDELKQANRVLKDENGRLYKLLGERDEEMRIIRKKRDSERKALAGTGVAADTAAGKIVELSKKNRDLTADLQSEKNKARQLAKRVQELEAKVVNESRVIQEQASNHKGSDDETKELQDKLKASNFKMSEYRNQCEALKKELKVATKVLGKELGEHVNVASILNEPSGWRGRQQQISALQNKVTELKSQLHEVARCGSTTSSNFLLRSSMATPSVMSSQYDEKHKSMLRKIEKDKKDTLEKTQVQLDKMTEDHSRLQQKLDASKARNKVLSNELKSVKAQIKTLVEKGSHDDELIAALMREQEHLKQSAAKKSATPTPQPQVIVTQDTTMINHLKQLCTQQESRVKELERELENTEQQLRQEKMEHEIKPPSSPPSRPETADAMCSTDDLRPMPQPPPLKEQKKPQSPASRNSRFGYGPLPPTPPSAGRSSRVRRSSASNSEEMHVLRCHIQELKSTCQVAEVERDRLLELVAVLQRRNDEEKSKCLQITTKLQEQRRVNAHVEKQLGRVQSSQNIKSTNYGKVRQRGSSRLAGDDNENSEEVDELRTWLDIQKDENDALKEALNSTLKAKEEDLKFYQDMMEQTKKVFLQGLRQFRQNSAPS